MNANNPSARGCGCSTQTSSCDTPNGNAGCGCDCGCDCESRCCELECLVRPNFFCGQLLNDTDLVAMVDWTRKRLALARYRDGWGIACGLDLTCADPRGAVACCDEASQSPPPSPVVYLTPGYAVDCCGNDLVVCDPLRVDLSSVCVAAEDPCTPAPALGAQAGNEAPVRSLGPDCLSVVVEGLFAVQVSLRYRETLANGMRPLTRTGCGDAAGCDYSRVQEAPCVHVEEVPLAAPMDDDHAAAAWAVDFAGHLRRDSGIVRSLLAKGPGELARFVSRNPPHSLCVLLDMACCLRDQAVAAPAGQLLAPAAVPSPALRKLGVYLLIDRLLGHLQCDCGACASDSGVVLGRVLMRRYKVKRETRCKVLAIDPTGRRPLRRDPCRPVRAGHVDLLALLWQTPDAASTALQRSGRAIHAVPLSMAEADVDATTDLLVNQAVSTDPADRAPLFACTMSDPFGVVRIAAFSLVSPVVAPAGPAPA